MNDGTYIDALDYAKSVAGRLESVSFKEYFLRHERTTKKLIEEEWPLACLWKILYHPDRRIKVLYRGTEPDAVTDAELIVEGAQKVLEGWDDVTPIEITSVQYSESHLVRKELGLTGSSYGPGSLSKGKGQNRVSQMVARDYNDDIVKFIPVAIASLKKKYQKVYPENSIILCAIFPEKSFGRAYWNMLLDEISERLSGSVKYKTVILDTFTCQHFVINVS